ncbi:hypothetical protein FACS189443_5780 [Planctomycetales bacterium]|nr:hypothetical protein FACS189443_5780 [Planctomycetales bacterium]
MTERKAALDLSCLALTKAVQLLNSTNHGTILSYRQLRYIKEEAGLQVAARNDITKIDLLKLARRVFSDKKQKQSKIDSKEAKKIRDIGYRRQQTLDKQEIGLPPPRANPENWELACFDFQYLCETYKADAFDLKWSPDHLKVFELCGDAIDNALMYALAMPRGSGKTAIFESLVEWVILTGRKKFALLVAATGTKADELMVEIKTSFNTNEKLQADFSPELHGIVALEDEARRCGGQRCGGKKTGVKWFSDKIVMPAIDGSKCSGSVIVTSGILGAINGLKHTTIDGRVIRPDIALVDDPQTLDSALSLVKSKKRIDVLHQSIRGLAGPKRGITMVMACTKMYENDLACQIMDAKKYPQWTTHTFKMMLSFPSNMQRWDEYWNIRSGIGKSNKDKALDFYRKHRAEMDTGAKMYWNDRFREDEKEISGIQHMMNLYYENSHVFWSEYQNEPQSEGTNIFRLAQRPHVESLCVDELAGTIPNNAMLVVAHIDIHKNIHYGTASALTQDGTMRKCWHGTFPNQGRLHFEQRIPPNPIPDNENDAPIINELVTAIQFFANARWTKPNGVRLPTTVITIDFRWKPEYTLSAMANSGFGAICIPYMGMPVNPDQCPIKEYTVKPGDSKGDYWYLTTNNEYLVPIIKVDVNAMKEQFHSKLLLESGKVGSVSFNGGLPQGADSRAWNAMLIEHLFSKDPVFKEGKRTLRTKLMWVDKLGKPDDHYFDCLVANLTMGDVYGCKSAAPAKHNAKAVIAQKNITNQTDNYRAGGNVRYNTHYY